MKDAETRRSSPILSIVFLVPQIYNLPQIPFFFSFEVPLKVPIGYQFPPQHFYFGIISDWRQEPWNGLQLLTIGNSIFYITCKSLGSKRWSHLFNDSFITAPPSLKENKSWKLSFSTASSCIERSDIQWNILYPLKIDLKIHCSK